MSDLTAALMVAIRVHAAQTDLQGAPYLLHVLRVVEAVDSERAKILAALHDVVEDGGPNFVALEDLFRDDGMFIANSVEVLTRESSETYADYIEDICDGHSGTWYAEVREVKLADLRDNLGRIPTYSGGPSGEMIGANPEWVSLKARYEKAIETLEGASRMLSSDLNGDEAST